MSRTWTSTRRSLTAILVVATAAGGLALATPATAAAAPSCGYKVTNVKEGPQYDNFSHGSGWSIVGEPGETLKFDKALAYTNSWTATVGVSASVVSASLGYTVGQTETVTTGASFTVPAGGGGRWALQAGTIDQTVTFDVVSDCGGKVVGRGHAKKTGPITTRHYKLQPDSTVADGVGGGGKPKAHL